MTESLIAYSCKLEVEAADRIDVFTLLAAALNGKTLATGGNTFDTSADTR